MKRSKMSLMPWVGGAVSLVFATTAMAAQPLVDAAWVKDHSCDPNVRVLDIRNKWDGSRKGDYQKGHIPCAIYSDYSSAGWRAKVDNTPGQMSPVAKLEELIGGLGISNDNHVVIYSRGTNALDMGSATRVYLTFKALGHDEVSILNGGYFGYTADEKNPVEKGTHKSLPAKFTADLQEDMIVTKADVAKASASGGVTVDLRPAHQYLGINKHPKASRYGTIPGSANLPESWLTANGGSKWRSESELKQLFAAAGVPETGEEYFFCNSGHWATLGWFASSELMGNKDAKMYDGSMIEWTNDKSLPMEATVNLN